jgi:hypothetical protein
MYRIVLSCSGVPESVGPEAATDITMEFAEHRPWHQNVLCSWDGKRLRLQADGESEVSSAALSDEFSDALSAYVAEPFDGSINVESITQLAAGA